MKVSSGSNPTFQSPSGPGKPPTSSSARVETFQPLHENTGTSINLSKLERRLVEDAIKPGHSIPGTNGLVMKAGATTFEIVTLPDSFISDQGQRRRLRILIHYRALAHIASAPGRISEINERLNAETIQTWLKRSLDDVQQQLKPWLLHQCTETGRYILTIFEVADHPPRATRLILSDGSTQRLITAYPILNDAQWQKAGKTLLGTDLELITGAQPELIPIKLRALFQIDDLMSSHQSLSSNTTAAVHHTQHIDHHTLELEQLQLSQPHADSNTPASATILAMDMAQDAVSASLFDLNMTIENQIAHYASLADRIDRLDRYNTEGRKLQLDEITPTQSFYYQINSYQCNIFETIADLQSGDIIAFAQQKALTQHIDSLAAMIRTCPKSLRPSARQDLEKAKTVANLLDQLIHKTRFNMCRTLIGWLVTMTPMQQQNLTVIDMINTNTENAKKINSQVDNSTSQQATSPKVYMDALQTYLKFVKAILHEFDTQVYMPEFDTTEAKQLLEALTAPHIYLSETFNLVLKLETEMNPYISGLVVRMTECARATENITHWVSGIRPQNTPAERSDHPPYQLDKETVTQLCVIVGTLGRLKKVANRTSTLISEINKKEFRLKRIAMNKRISSIKTFIDTIGTKSLPIDQSGRIMTTKNPKVHAEI